MGTVIPQSELTRRAIDWICEQAGPGASPAELSKQIEAAAMRFNQSNRNLNAAVLLFPGGFEHGIGFADARTHSQKNAQPAAALLAVELLDCGQ